MAETPLRAAPQPRTAEEKLARVAGGAGSPNIKEYGLAPYALVVTVRMSAQDWPSVWYSWLSLKGHLQAFHYVESTYQFTSRIEDEVIALFVVSFESDGGVAAWLREGFTVDQMLREMGVPEDAYSVQMMRDFS